MLTSESKNISFPLDQFSHTDDLISEVSGELIGPTVSLCHHCYQHIPAHTYHKDNQLWMVKKCRVHGTSHHMIERDYEFVKNLNYNYHEYGIYSNKAVLIEVSDRCNIDCPHCYHIPDNTIPDKPIKEIIDRVRTFFQPGMDLVLTGAEASIRKDLADLIRALKEEFVDIEISILTNGIRFADKDFLKQCIDAGLKRIRLGLNHPSYLDNPTIRNKQIQSIYNLKDLGNIMGYIGYTMASINELEDILYESTNSDWNPSMFRIRYGSDIGRYPDQERMYVSDIFKITQAWCEKNKKTFEIIQADNNIYHVMVNIDGVPYRLIQWCDETDINMEELRGGPWCDFVPDGVTNFLHQIIRRDVWKNKGLVLPDTPPDRYTLKSQNSNQPLVFDDLHK
jgi:MoaA/NifB/PqqE/SkfB family radical SAM enzyme